MKKLLLSMYMIALSTLGFGQLNYDVWETVDIVDEFGDSTGESVIRTFAKGTFSNSATSNADLIVKVVDYGDAVMMELYEYSKAPGVSMCYDGCIGEISVKNSSGEIKTHSSFAPESGGLYFNSDDSFFNLIHNNLGETIKVVVRERNFSKYGSSSYVFEMITQ
tara:strand:+ start:407 stop:898 length:492 start_codon:yes stop_codon:yes gene_type:complete